MGILKYKKEIIVLGIIGIIFLVSSYYSQIYLSTLTELLGTYTLIGMLVYVVGATIATVAAPFSFLPVLPVAVALWGSFIAALLSIVGWSLGAAIAFLLARRYGRPLVAHLIGEQKMQFISHFSPRRYLFVAVVFLRMALPVDVLSYALGLFGAMRFTPYMVATVVGITPFAFVFAYLAVVPPWYQFGALVLGAVFIVLGLPYMKKHYAEIFLSERG